MKTFANLLISIVIASWVLGVAILSVQNAEPVSLKLLTFQSIQIPVGIVLAFCAGVGIVGMALLQPLWGLAGSEQKNSRLEDETEFFPDEEF
ncbi:LapA family protein [Scytonema tolypothrichoides VB-61278]|nr:LapA family protein [Scytonema tolypothrichoides VB-61278]